MSEIDFDVAIEKALRQDEEEYDGHDEDTFDGVFHASWMGYCKRNILISKQGIGLKDREGLGRLMMGSFIHEFMENEVAEFVPGDDVEMEDPIPDLEQGDLTFVGTADVVDHENEIIYDFKSRASWYKFDPPIQRHIDQLQIYMEAFGYDRAKVVYISKSDMEVRTYPSEEGEFIERDPSRYYELVAKAYQVYDHLQENGGVESLEHLNHVYKPCDNFFCGDEDLSLPEPEPEPEEEEESEEEEVDEDEG